MTGDPFVLELLDQVTDIDGVVSDVEVLVVLPLGQPEGELDLPLTTYGGNVEIEAASGDGQDRQLVSSGKGCLNWDTVLVKFLLS